MQKHVNLVDLVKSFPTNINLQKSASIQPRTSHLIFIILAASRDLIFTERSSLDLAAECRVASRRNSLPSVRENTAEHWLRLRMKFCRFADSCGTLRKFPDVERFSQSQPCRGMIKLRCASHRCGSLRFVVLVGAIRVGAIAGGARVPVPLRPL